MAGALHLFPSLDQDVQRNWYFAQAAVGPGGPPRRRQVALGHHHQQIDIAVLVWVAPCVGAEEDDPLRRVLRHQPLCDLLELLGEPSAGRRWMVGILRRVHSLGLEGSNGLRTSLGFRGPARSAALPVGWDLPAGLPTRTSSRGVRAPANPLREKGPSDGCSNPDRWADRPWNGDGAGPQLSIRGDPEAPGSVVSPGTRRGLHRVPLRSCRRLKGAAIS